MPRYRCHAFEEFPCPKMARQGALNILPKSPMEFSNEQYYRALKAQDARFDGQFYICVTSTGIYCRPICPARMTRFEHCIFVKTAAAAERAGYRPCLRCRPETAPGSPLRRGTGATVSRALRLISESAAEGFSLDDLAGRLGIGARHLRRLFSEQLGATPKSIVQTERFSIARQLLRETNLPIGEVAFASGFGSIRRFNDAMQKSFGMSPREFRNRRRTSPSGTSGTRLLLGYRPPFAWPQLLDFFRVRAVNRLEAVTNVEYRRTITIGEVRGVLSVRHDDGRNRLVAEFHMERPVILADALQRIRDMFDLDAAPTEIAEHLQSDLMIAPMIASCPGLRVPGSWDVFELVVRAVIGQQISVKGAATLMGRLVERFGNPVAAEGEDAGANLPDLLFPDPSNLAGSDVRKIGLTGSRARTLMALAEAFAADPAYVHPAMDFGEARKRLLAFPGIGPWTAEYIALRALRNPDAFPDSDLGLLKGSGLPSAAALKARAESWRPWRGYAALHIWNS